MFVADADGLGSGASPGDGSNVGLEDADELGVASGDGPVEATATTAVPAIANAPAMPAAVIQVDLGMAFSLVPGTRVGHHTPKAAEGCPSAALPHR
ncbi:MAG: hypothetical protein ACRDWI_00330 [Jiangellaceae bacterium]